MSRSSVLFGKSFKWCSPGDQEQLVRQAVQQMEDCLEYPELNDIPSVKRRIRYIIRKAKEYGIEVK